MLIMGILIVSRYLHLLQSFSASMVGAVRIVVEIGRVDDIERVTSRGTPTRMCVGEGRLPKSLLIVEIGHYSPSAT